MRDKRHIFRQIDRDLDHIDHLVVFIWDLVESQWRSALRAVQASEPAPTPDLSGRKRSVEEYVGEIERASTRFLALRQPMADDLRFIIASLRISIDLERIGVYAANIAKRAALSRVGAIAPPISEIREMTEITLRMLLGLRQDYSTRSLSLAASVVAMDEQVNELYERVFTDLRSRMAQDPSQIEVCTELLFIARNIERSGDHAKNIAKHLGYLFLGTPYEDSCPREPCADERGPD